MDSTNLDKDRKRRRKAAPDLSTMVYGKIPPQAKDFEEAILGALMLDKSIFDSISLIIKPESFYVESHQRIYAAIVEMQSTGIPIDINTVVEKLRQKEDLDICGGAYYITKLTNTVVSGAHAEFHAKIIQQKFVQRELIRISGELINDAYEDSADPFDLIERAEREVAEISIKHINAGLEHISNVVVKTIQELEDRRKIDSHIVGVASGYPELDRKTLGFQNGEFIIIAGRPGEGKTALAINIAANIALHETNPGPVAIWSLEMKPTKLVERMAAAKAGIPLTKIISARMTDDDMTNLFNRALKYLGSSDIFFDAQTGITVQQIKAKARKYKRKHNLRIMFVDYLQLITAKDGFNREQQVSQISREFKTLSLELDIPIIALSQMSRNVENRPGRVPVLSDLRESGAIEQDADMVMFIWKPTEVEIKENESLRGKTRVRIAKQRNGTEDFFTCDFNKTIQLISNVMPQDGHSFTATPAEGWRPVTIPGIDFSEPTRKVDADSSFLTEDDD